MIAPLVAVMLIKNRRKLSIIFSLYGLFSLIIGELCLSSIRKHSILHSVIDMRIGLIFVIVAVIGWNILMKRPGRSVQRGGFVSSVELTLSETMLLVIASLLHIVEGYIFAHGMMQRFADIGEGALFMCVVLYKWWSPKAERKYRQTHGIES